MVTVKLSQTHKSEEKTPAVSTLKPPVSPQGSTLEEEVHTLRVRNKILTEALASIKETADKECKKHYELVWYARNRGRFPNHGDAKRIEKEHSEELEKLKTAEGDFFHGIHCGLLAATRMFQDHAEIVEAIQGDDDGGHLIEEAVKFEQKKQESVESFPHVAVDVAPVQKFATVN